MPEKLTIRDIARLAGVSTTTVSRTLNHKPDVDPETRERIMRIINDHHYVPSGTASRLAGGRSGLVGVLAPSLTWPLMPNILQGIAEVIEQTTYELVLYSISHRTDRSALIDRILGTGLIDGLIAVYPDGIAVVESSETVHHEASNHLLEVYQQGFPVVILDDQSLHSRIPWIGPDNRIGAYQATRHLIGLGHRRIAHIQGPTQYQCSYDRFAGYRQALAEAGIDYDPALVVHGDFTTPGGQAATERLLALADRPTAIFAANDQMAYGVMVAAGAHGLRVPRDLAVIGFDDIAVFAPTHPALSSVRQPFQEMGKRAAETLLSLANAPSGAPSGFDSAWYDHLAGAPPAPARDPLRAAHIQLPTELVVRESCGAQERQPSRDDQSGHQSGYQPIAD
ncbi:MAG TPA: LacI family DNA-binding transcriptional regulator [Ktedonobacterales bacterium]|jgi:LacI family transcriptional regulator|nr:LacI family DNA-binding transcriptional regulator [Ktedonobacterales bacterium]